MTSTRILGIDPGLNRTGWGVVDSAGNRLSHVAHGVVVSDPTDSMATRLAAIHTGLAAVIAEFAPDETAVEEVFVNKNPSSTLKLGMARGVAMLAPATAGLPVAEYAANLIKKSVVGAGHADKAQVAMMVSRLLPGTNATGGRRRRTGCRHLSRASSSPRGTFKLPRPSGEREEPRRQHRRG